MKEKFNVVIEILVILILFTNSIISYAGFADYDDATADAEAKNQLEQQEKEQKEKLGKSSNNYLSELSVKGYKITPEFDKQTINYSIENEILNDNIEIIANADDTKAKVTGSGSISLKPGENIILIEVTAENGTVRTYNIKVNKKIESNESKLANLEVFAENKDEKKEGELLVEKENGSYLLIIVIGTIIVIILLIILIKNNKKKKRRKH